MNGRCNASTKYFMDLYNVSRVSIQNWLKLLDDNNYIKRIIIYKQGSKQIEHRYITLINNPSKENLTLPSKENLTDNTTNTNTNITYNNNISIKEKFINQVMYFDYPKEMKQDFIDYWTEGVKKMRFQKQATFEIKLRLLRWSKNSAKWDKPKNIGTSKLDKQIDEWQKAKELIEKIQ
jgi:hypothetical protein